MDVWCVSMSVRMRGVRMIVRMTGEGVVSVRLIVLINGDMLVIEPELKADTPGVSARVRGMR